MEKTVEELVSELYAAKKAEEQAKAARVRAESALVEALKDALPETGSKTIATQTLKVTVKRGYIYRVDDLELFASAWPDLVKRTEKVELDVAAYERLRTEGGAGYLPVARHVTVTLAKPQVTLKA